jgi:cytoskeleton protein RodZ
MSSVGAYLRGLREKQGMSIDELSRATRVLHHYLEALEADNIGSLPAPVFTKGFIRAYCQALGVPPEEALQLYDRIGVPAPDVAKVPAGAVRIASVPEIQRLQVVQEPDYLTATPPGPPAQGEPREKRARGTLLMSFILLVVLGVAFFAVTLALQSGRQGDSEPSAQVAAPQFPAASESPVGSPVPAAAPAESPVLQSAGANQLAKQSPGAAPSAPATPSAPAPSVSPAPGTHTAAGAPATPTAPAVPGVPAAPKSPATASAATTPSAATVPPAAPAPSAAPSASVAAATTARGLGLPYRLIARTTETTWMRVRTEDGRTSEETIPANEIREWVSNGPFVITIGNAGGVSLELNGRPIPRLGASGAVVTRLVLPSDNP